MMLVFGRSHFDQLSMAKLVAEALRIIREPLKIRKCHETGHQARFIALNIANRCSRIGSFSTLLTLLKTIVGRSFALNCGHRGNLGVFGSPVRAKAIHASLTLSAR